MNLETWLKQENILSCLGGLKAAGVTEPYELCELTEQDLEAMLGWNLLTRRRVISAISKLNGMNLEPSILEVAKSRLPTAQVIKPGVRSKTKSPRLVPTSPHYRSKTKFPMPKSRRKGHKGRSRSVNGLSSISPNADDWCRLSDKSATSVKSMRARGGSRTREKRRKVTKFLPNGRAVTQWSIPGQNSIGEEEKPQSEIIKMASTSKLPNQGTALGSVMSMPVKHISNRDKMKRHLARQGSGRAPTKHRWTKASSVKGQRISPADQNRQEHPALKGGIRKFHAKSQNDYFSDPSSGENQNMQGFWGDWSDESGSPVYNESLLPNYSTDQAGESPTSPPNNMNPAQVGQTAEHGNFNLSSDEADYNRFPRVLDTQPTINFIPEDLALSPGDEYYNEAHHRRRSKSRRKGNYRRKYNTSATDLPYLDEIGSASPPLPNASNYHKQEMKNKRETSSVCFFRTDSIKCRRARSRSLDTISKPLVINPLGNDIPAGNFRIPNTRKKHDKRKDSNYEISDFFDNSVFGTKKKSIQWGDNSSLSSCALVKRPTEWVQSTSTLESITPLLDKKSVKGSKENAEFSNTQLFKDELFDPKQNYRVIPTKDRKEYKSSKDELEPQNSGFLQDDLFNQRQNLRVIPHLPSLTGIEDVVMTINNRLFDCQEPKLVSRVQSKIAVVVNLVKKMATSVLVELGSDEIKLINKFTEKRNIVMIFKKEIVLKCRSFEELLQLLLMERNPFGDLDVLLIEQRKLTEIVANNEDLLEGSEIVIKSREKSKLLVETFGQQAFLEIQRMPNPSKALQEMIAAVQNYKNEERVLENVKMALQKKKKLDRAISNSRRMEQYMENVMAQLRYNIQLMKACEKALGSTTERTSHKVIEMDSAVNHTDEKPKESEKFQKIPYTELSLRFNKPFEQTCKKIQRRCTGLSFMQLQFTFLMLKRHFMLLLRLYKTYTGLEGRSGQVFAGMSLSIWTACCRALQLPENFNTRQRNYLNEIFYQCSRTQTREKDSILRYDDFIESITQLAMHTSPEKEVWDAIEHLVMFHVIPKALDGWDVELPSRHVLGVFEEDNNKAVLERVFSHYCSYHDKEMQGKLLSFSKWEKMVYQKNEKVLSFLNWQKLCQDLTKIGVNYGTRFQQPTFQVQQFAFFTSKSLFPKRGCASYTDALCWEEFLEAVARLAFKAVVMGAQKEGHLIKDKTQILIRWLANMHN